MVYHPDENTSAEISTRYTLSRIKNFKSPRRCAIISLVLLAVVVLLTVGIILYLYHSSDECSSEACERSAKDLQKYMDLSVDPCEDFYSYVCGKAVEAEGHSRPKRRFNPMSFPDHVITDDVIYKAFLEQNNRKINALKAMPTYLQQIGLPTIATLLNHAKSLPSNYSFDWIRSIAQIQRTLGFNVFVSFDVIEDHLKSDRNRLTLGCNNVDVLSKMSSDAKGLARDLRELVQLFNPTINLVKDNIKFYTEAKALVNFRNSLPVVNDDAAGENSAYYTAAELQNVTNSSHPVWQHYLDVLFAELPSVKPAVDEKLQLGSGNLKCIGDLVSFLSKQPPAVVELYVWLAVTVHSIDNWEFLDKTKPRVEQMFNGIRSSFNKMVLQTNWMDSATKNASITRTQEMSSLIDFPKWILDFDTLKERYQQLQTDDVNVLENWVGAQKLLNTIKLQFWEVKNHTIWNKGVTENDVYYLWKYNVIKIPRTMIRYPVFNRGLEALNYGRLGVSIGIMMAIGVDGSGNYQQLWSNETLQQYGNRTGCLDNQINGTSLTVKQCDGYASEIGELRAAIGAYREYVKNNGPEQLLPRFDNFNHDQLFFISYGNQYCGKTKNQRSLSKIRLQTVLGNMDEFSEVFKCPTGSTMNPEEKCHIW